MGESTQNHPGYFATGAADVGNTESGGIVMCPLRRRRRRGRGRSGGRTASRPPSLLVILLLSPFLFAPPSSGRTAAAFIAGPVIRPLPPRYPPPPPSAPTDAGGSCCSAVSPSPSALRALPPDASDLLLQGLAASSVVVADASASAATTTTAASNILDLIRSDPHPDRYAFMLPTAVVVATSCQLAGIGGAALFSPIFLLVFPLLGPEYPLPSAAAAVASALLTECFGFASGLTGYASRGLVDWGVAGRFLVISVPSALAGALLAGNVAGYPVLLRSVYAALMIGLALYLTLSPAPEALERLAEEECAIPGDDDAVSAIRTRTARDGTEFTYLDPPDGSARGAGATAAGGSLTGLLGVGIGEVVLPQLVRGCCMPLPVAAGTSVAVVVVTALTAATVQFAALAMGIDGAGAEADGGAASSLVDGLVRVVPWNLVRYTIPGVLIGGQVAPFLASRGQFSDEVIERFAATLFGSVGIAFAVKAIVG